MASPHFRAGVVIVVRGLDDRLLAFERNDVRGQWQFPQGGVEADEDPIAAAPSMPELFATTSSECPRTDFAEARAVADDETTDRFEPSNEASWGPRIAGLADAARPAHDTS